MSSEILNGTNKAKDNAMIRDIQNAEEVIDPARAAPLGWLADDLGLGRPSRNRGPTNDELTGLKVAYADAFLALDEADPYDDDAWDAAMERQLTAWANLREAHRTRKAGAQ